MSRVKFCALAGALAFVVSCGGKSPTAPTIDKPAGTNVPPTTVASFGSITLHQAVFDPYGQNFGAEIAPDRKDEASHTYWFTLPANQYDLKIVLNNPQASGRTVEYGLTNLVGWEPRTSTVDLFEEPSFPATKTVKASINVLKDTSFTYDASGKETGGNLATPTPLAFKIIVTYAK